jgi:RNA polymerase sigma-70 factor (ECF subfamily)
MNRLPLYFRRLQKLLLRRGRSREDAEDLIQEAFLRMQEYCGNGGEVHKPEHFLVRTVLRLAINARRDAHRDLYVDQNVEELTFVIDANPMPDELLAADECLERMRDALNAVSPRTRDVFFMNRLDGLTYAQIARQMRLSISAIEKHMASALVALANVSGPT